MNDGSDGMATTAAADEKTALRESVIQTLKTVYDPEIPVDIYELGLIYEVAVTDDASVAIRMTLTSPMCPVAETLPPEVESKARSVPGVRDVRLDLVWGPAVASLNDVRSRETRTGHGRVMARAKASAAAADDDHAVHHNATLRRARANQRPPFK